VIELSWRAGLDAAEAADVTALATAATAADGTAPLGEHVLLHLTHDDVAHLLALDDGGVLRGVAQLDPAEGVAELVVHPEHRRAGLGRRLVEEVLARAGGTLRVWAHGQYPGAVALAARLGFTPVRELWQMRRSLLDPLPEPQLPAGVRLRPFAVGKDDEEFLRVNNAAFDWHPEQGGWDRAQLQLRAAEPWFDPAGFLLGTDPIDCSGSTGPRCTPHPSRSVRSTCSASTLRRAACGWAPRSPSPGCGTSATAGRRG
jgi:mycothiol synthase